MSDIRPGDDYASFDLNRERELIAEIARLRAENEAKDKRIAELQSMLKAARAAREG